MRNLITILVSVFLCSCASHRTVRDMPAHPSMSCMSTDDLAWIAGADARPMDGADPSWITSADAARLAVELLSNKGYIHAKCSGMSIGAQYDYYFFDIEGKGSAIVQVDRNSKKAKISRWTPSDKGLKTQ